MSDERVLEIFRMVTKILNAAREINDPRPALRLPAADIQMIRDLPDEAEHMDHVIIGGDGRVRILGVELIPA